VRNEYEGIRKHRSEGRAGLVKKEGIPSYGVSVRILSQHSGTGQLGRVFSTLACPRLSLRSPFSCQ
jgi:hypothetical protein